MIKKNQPGGAEISSKIYESPKVTSHLIIPESGFAVSGDIEDMEKWNKWETAE